MSALPSRFVTDGLLLSPSSYYPEWNFGRLVGKSNMLPSLPKPPELPDAGPTAATTISIHPNGSSRIRYNSKWFVENQIQLGNGLEPDPNAEVPPAIAFVNGPISLELDDLR